MEVGFKTFLPTNGTLLPNHWKILSLTSNDRLLGILPVFHSFGLAGAVVLPLCTGLRTVYWPNPTEGLQLARMIGAYSATTLLTTPTFLNGVLRAGKPDLLHSLRLVFSGAEKCPDHIFATFMDNYGIDKTM